MAKSEPFVNRVASEIYRPPGRARRASPAVAAMLALLSLPPGARAADNPAPGFWDPQHRLERPDTTSLRLVRFTIEDDYPPFGFALPDGTLAGFNVELAREICEELRIACTVQPRRWDTILPSIEDGRSDAAIASVAITRENRQRVDFSAPYYKTPARFAVAASSGLVDAIPETLAGKAIGVEARTAHEAWLRDFFPGSDIRPYETAAALRAALRRGEVEAIFGDGVTLALWLNGTDAAGCCAFRGGPFLHSAYFGEGVGVAVRKNNSTLRRAIDFALARIAARGVYADLYLKYFPVGFF